MAELSPLFPLPSYFISVVLASLAFHLCFFKCDSLSSCPAKKKGQTQSMASLLRLPLLHL